MLHKFIKKVMDQSRNVVVLTEDLNGLHMDMDDIVQMLPEGTIVELIINLDPSLYRNTFGIIREENP